MFIDREPAKQQTEKDKQDAIVRYSLLPKSYGPLKVFDADDTRVKIEQKVISNNFSRDRVTKDPFTTVAEKDGGEQTPLAGEGEYAVHHIVDYRDGQDGTRT